MPGTRKKTWSLAEINLPFNEFGVKNSQVNQPLLMVQKSEREPPEM